MAEHVEDYLVLAIHLVFQIQVQVVVELQPIHLDLLVALVLALVTTAVLQQPQQVVVAAVHQQ
jgi:hypothetical protein